MKSLLLAAALGLGSLGLIGLTPAKADASWLSEALHRRFDPNYYGYYAAPAYDYGYYGGPAYSYYDPGYVAPYYVAPYRSFYWSGPRYYGRWGGHWGGWHGEHHGGWHGGHEWHGGHHHR